eukprot:365333-Chlamydomonas_euryale.AAC.18
MCARVQEQRACVRVCRRVRAPPQRAPLAGLRRPHIALQPCRRDALGAQLLARGVEHLLAPAGYEHCRAVQAWPGVDAHRASIWDGMAYGFPYGFSLAPLPAQGTREQQCSTRLARPSVHMPGTARCPHAWHGRHPVLSLVAPDAGTARPAPASTLPAPPSVWLQAPSPCMQPVVVVAPEWSTSLPRDQQFVERSHLCKKRNALTKRGSAGAASGSTCTHACTCAQLTQCHTSHTSLTQLLCNFQADAGAAARNQSGLQSRAVIRQRRM